MAHSAAHRSGPLKQANKSHKTGKHRSKGAVDALNRGRVSSVSSGGISKAKHAVQSKIVKRNKLKQLKKIKYDQVLEEKKALSSGSAPPQLVAVIGLTENLEFSSQIGNFLQNSGDWVIEENGHIRSPQKFRRRFHFVQPQVSDILSLLDVTKVCDSVIYVIDENVGVKEEKIIFSIAAQGIPTAPVFVFDSAESDAKKKQQKYKNVRKWIDNVCPNASDKLFQVSSEQQVVQLLRHLGDQKRSKFNSLRSNRAHIFAENLHYVQQGAMGTLQITGYIRGEKMNVNRLIHIPGWGDFQVEQIQKLADPHALAKSRGDVNMTETVNIVPSNELQDDLTAENEPDMMDGEQTWPTVDELEEAEAASKKKRTVKVPKGTSDYQAAWIVDEADEDDEEDEDDNEMEDKLDPIEEESDEEDEMEEEEDEETEETNEEASDAYDTKHVKFADEQDAYNKIKAARQDEMFPDEVDTPIDMPARDRFQKYRGLKSFRTSPWDPKENLPFDYSRIFQFENFNRTKKNVLAANEDEGQEFVLDCGSFCTISIKNVPSHFFIDWSKNPVPLVAFSMLKHENKMSVMNVAVKRLIDPMNCDAIASKERLIFHVGYRRFAAQPIFSAHTNGSKHKYERFWRPDEMIVMSMYAPIMYPPSNVLVYRELASGRQSLVGTGNLLAMTPDRLVIKRAVLSGHPFKVHKRSAVVRFMFFNRQDIEWFKPVELRTKHGRRGHIKEPLGTHGHMKVFMDKPVTQQDTILMNLYKRVFPKWTYDPYVNRFVKSSNNQNDKVQVMEV